MPYRRNNYDFVIDSSFQPFSMQEMLVPFTMYKDAYEKSEAAYEELSQKAGDFKYLASTLPEGSEARSIYESYANDLETQAADLSHNGLSMNNRRALTELKRRYSGEIGRLVKADAAMQEEKKLRRAMRDKDSSILYADENLGIDAFLDGKTPNLYSVSGDELRKEGAIYAQQASSRVYGNSRVQNINKYYQDIIQEQGYSPELLSAWRQSLEGIPEFNQAVEDIMKARGVEGNLTGINYERARQNVINGIMEGSVYKESRSSHQNPGVLTAAQEVEAERANRSMMLTATGSNMKWDKASGTWVFDEEMAKKKQEYALSNPTNPDNPQYNPDNWEAKPDGKGGYTYVRKQKPKEEKDNIKLNDPAAYDADGNRYQVGNKDGKNLGKVISYEEAVSDERFTQRVSTHHPGFEDCYDYSIAKIGNKDVIIFLPNERKLAEKINRNKANPSQPGSAKTPPTGDPSKTNALN